MSLTKPGNEQSRPGKSRIGVAIIALTLAVTHILIVQTPASAAHEIRVPTGTLTDFSVLAHSLITDTGGTSTFADGVGVWPGNSVVGISDEDVDSGGIHLGDEVAEQAQSDFLEAYNYAAAQTATPIAAELGGQTLKPGVYSTGGTALSLGTTLTLDADGDKNAIFIIQTEGAFGSTATTGEVVLIDGAQECNVFFQVAGAVTLGASSTFRGTLLSQGAITVGAGASFSGRAFTGSGDMTLSDNRFDEPSCDGTTVTPTATPLETTEAGGIATFTVVLNSQPSGEVTIGASSSDATEGTVDKDLLTFTTVDWATPQTVTVTGVDDSIDDGDIGYTVVLAPADGGGFTGVNSPDVDVVNTDDDTVGVTVAPVVGLITTEAGAADTFTVVLDTLPSADVTIAVSSSDATEGTVDKDLLTFTTVDWATAQTVTVTGVNDAVVDGDIGYSVVLATASGGDYDGIDPADVSVTNVDNDPVGITVSPTSGLVTTETGGMDSFTVVLDSQPSADVTIGVTSNDLSEGTVDKDLLTFTTVDWATAQTVTVTGFDDSVVDGDVGYSVVLAAATGGDYDGIDPADVDLRNSDDDAVGVTVAPVGGLISTEAGTADSFTVVLDTQPSAGVAIEVSSSDMSEGTVDKDLLTFTTVDWATAQTVTVTGVDDEVEDGDVTYSVVLAAATGGDYAGLDPADVAVVNSDDDTVGVTVTPIATPLVTTEAGDMATFTVVLDSQPSADVSIGVSSSDTTEGTVDSDVLTFTTVDWATAQTVTVTGVDDSVEDGDVAYSVVLAAATGGDYAGIDPADVAVVNSDDDTVGVTVTPMATPLVTTEAGDMATFTVVLDSQPSADVTIGVSSSNTTEGTVDRAFLTFTPVNWTTAQTVTVTGVNDSVEDGDVVYSVVLAAATGGDYAGIDPDDVAVSNTDDDTIGITVAPTSGLVTTETGGTATFTVVLDSQPSAEVTIGVSSDDTTEGTASTPSLLFSTQNWATAQTVTVTGVDDEVEDGDVAYSVVLGVATGGDYAGIDPDDVTVVNTMGLAEGGACTHDFADVDDSNIFEASICWLADQGITMGCNPPLNTQFCPKEPVTRGQMAAFLVRAFGYTDDGGGDLFTDDDGSTFEAAIDRLGTAGVTLGCNPPLNTWFCPKEPVTRGQMAAFLVRAFGYTDDGGGDLFTDDDGSTFEAAIDRLGTAGVTLGCNPPSNTQFCPDDPVTREQMAAFLKRAFEG